MTAATASGVGEAGVRGRAIGNLADFAGFRSIHSHRIAAVNAPDKIEWTCRMVLADIGRH